MRLYRFLTGPEDSIFCHKVSQALGDGWDLHGSPSLAFDAAKGELVCGQAVTKEVSGAYSPDMKLSDQ